MTSPSNILYLLDTSRYVNRIDLENMIKYVGNDVMMNSHNGTKIGIINYGSRAEVVSPITDDKSAAIKELKKIALIRGNQQLHFALKEANTFPNLRQERSTSRIVLFTFGEASSDGRQSTENLAENLKDQDIKIIIVAVGKNRKDENLESIASSKGSVIYINNSIQLPNTVPDLFKITQENLGMKIHFQYLV